MERVRMLYQKLLEESDDFAEYVDQKQEKTTKELLDESIEGIDLLLEKLHKIS